MPEAPAKPWEISPSFFYVAIQNVSFTCLSLLCALAKPASASIVPLPCLRLAQGSWFRAQKARSAAVAQLWSVCRSIEQSENFDSRVGFVATMGSNVQFQLFPPPPPKINTNVDQNPFRRVQSKPAAEGTSFPQQTLVKSPGTETVIIQIIEGPHEIRPVPQAHVAPLKKDQTPESEAGNHALVTAESGVHSLPGFPPPAPISVCSASPTLVTGNGSPLQPAPKSPIVPMRSMFPTYNPNLPLSQQPYYPQREASLQGQVVSREEYSPHLTSPSQLDEVLGGVKTAPSSVLEFPMEDVALKAPRFSSAQELDRLWEATNGQDAEAAPSGFDLQMSRIDPATFTFGSTPSLPFYTLQTFSTNELSIQRTNPRKPTIKIPIVLLSLESEARRLPPNDGLVTYIFPKLAAMLAIDQSNELAAEHGLASTHRDEIQSEAVARAASQESCRLTWKEAGRRYELAHPAIGRDANKSPRFAQTPTSPLEADPPVVHITVSSHALPSPQSMAAPPPVILVTNPNRSSSLFSTPADMRVSTLPEHESNEPLASLDFATMTLHISAKTILTLMPSLYAIDSLVSAILAVAVADEATNPIMAQMDIWTPRLSPAPPGSVLGGGSVGGKSYAGSVLYATLAEREEAEEEARLMRQVHDNDTRDKVKGAGKKRFWRRRPKAEKRRRKQILVGEFDLEKLGHYQSGAREGQKLPGVTRSVLKAMVLLLQLVVWGLTTLVRVLAWILVGATRAVTSEKF